MESPVEKKTRSVVRVALFGIASVALILFYGSLFASRTLAWVPADIGVVALATAWGVVLLVSPGEKLLRRVLTWYMTLSSILVAGWSDRLHRPLATDRAALTEPPHSAWLESVLNVENVGS
jgi:hypothetical protein